MNASRQPPHAHMKSIEMQPIAIRDTILSKAYHHIHTVVIASLFIYSFPDLVHDRTSTLVRTILPIVVLQAIYSIICLPTTTSNHVLNASNSKPTSNKQKSVSSAASDLKLMPVVISLILTFTIALPCFTILLVLFGAPLTTHHLHTLLCATHLSLLSAPHLIYLYGVSASKWRRIISLDIPIDSVFGSALGTCIGAWFGAVPIPLDWDRDWQRWPITIVTGAYIGWAIGRSLGGMEGVGFGRRISL